MDTPKREAGHANACVFTLRIGSTHRNVCADDPHPAAAAIGYLPPEASFTDACRVMPKSMTELYPPSSYRERPE
ncbi:hypothetical protein JX265_000902 [Neoarthrinium moseri]|uniref:Uncharacterized protein n=1 Tax=Neoarthrinium moseri TaxID=1658444 RepID=A0A9Q0AU27_9PEZI|nr:uncharacterized protein JN550_006992 [Neoarthrinium moseri]KAI1847664.1 hypothetical protein JX266_006516 [Neoarthrinium moseri]KAI1867261.1 hypothetical protein JN550_006992 [Neoarthrinium moseri]KAI1880662.1 hypothetical protein JX265_000902 [Neoarthrinium moseri]